jgi:hypothetical protein
MIPGTMYRLVAGAASLFARASTPVKIAVLSVTLVFLLAGFVIWQIGAVSQAGNNALIGIWNIFGWGLVVLTLAVVVAVGALFKPEISTFVESSRLGHWNRWVGGLILVAAVWGLLGAFGLGGAIGYFIVGEFSPLYIKILIEFVLFLAAILFIAPGLTLGRFIPSLRQPAYTPDMGSLHTSMPQPQPPVMNPTVVNKDRPVIAPKRTSIIGMSGTPAPSSRKWGPAPEPSFPQGPTVIPGRVPTTARVEYPAPVFPVKATDLLLHSP